MSDFQIFRLFVYESWIIGMIGTVIGIILSSFMIYYMVAHGVDYTAIFEKSNVKDFGYRVYGILRGAWNYKTIIACFVFGPLVSAIAAAVPARRATKLSIIDCLRFE
jgi:ABC-type lipoprotein release transport system permease subunit